MDLSNDLLVLKWIVIKAKLLKNKKILVSESFMSFLEKLFRDGDGVDLIASGPDSKEIKGEVLYYMGVYLYSNKEDYDNHK